MPCSLLKSSPFRLRNFLAQKSREEKAGKQAEQKIFNVADAWIIFNVHTQPDIRAAYMDSH